MRDKLTSGTTWHTAGLIASSGMAGETLAWIVRYTRALYQGHVAETGISTGFLQCGHLHVATTPKLRRLRVPATKFICITKRLNAALRGGFCVSRTRGSTVEAREKEIMRATAQQKTMDLA